MTYGLAMDELLKMFKWKNIAGVAFIHFTLEYVELVFVFNVIGALQNLSMMMMMMMMMFGIDSLL